MPIISYLIPNQTHCYKAYKIIAKQNLDQYTGSVIIQSNKNFKVIKVVKKFIGLTKNQEGTFLIDSKGKLIKTHENNENTSYITVSGQIKYWHLYYKELEKYPNLLKQIMHVHIYSHRIDLYIYPGVILKINRSIEDAYDFFKTYPKYFKKKNFYIDIRNTKQVCYKKLDINVFE